MVKISISEYSNFYVKTKKTDDLKKHKYIVQQISIHYYFSFNNKRFNVLHRREKN